MALSSNQVKEVCEFFKGVLLSKDGGPVFYHNLRGFVASAPENVKQYVKKICKEDNLLKFFRKHNEYFLVEKFNIFLKTDKPYKLPKDEINEKFSSSKPSCSQKASINVKQTDEERIQYTSKTKEFFIKLLTEQHELVVNAIDIDILPKKVWYFLKKYMNSKVENFFINFPDLFLVDEGYVRLIKQLPVTEGTSSVEPVTKSVDECNEVKSTPCTDAQTFEENDLVCFLQVVDFFVRILQKKSPIRVKNLSGYFSHAAPCISLYVKENYKPWPLFLESAPKIFLLNGDEVSLNHNYKKNLKHARKFINSTKSSSMIAKDLIKSLFSIPQYRSSERNDELVDSKVKGINVKDTHESLEIEDVGNLAIDKDKICHEDQNTSIIKEAEVVNTFSKEEKDTDEVMELGIKAQNICTKDCDKNLLKNQNLLSELKTISITEENKKEEVNLGIIFESLVDCYYTVHFICFKIIEKEDILCLEHDYKAVKFFVDILINSPSCIFPNNMKCLQDKLGQADRDTLQFMKQLYKGDKIKHFFMKHKEFHFDPTNLSVELSETYNINLQNTASAQKYFVKSKSYLEKLCSYFWVQLCIDVFKALFQLAVFLKNKQKVKLSRLFGHVSEMKFLDVLKQLDGNDHMKKLENFLNCFTFFIHVGDKEYALCDQVKFEKFFNALEEFSSGFSEKSVNLIASKIHFNFCLKNCLPESLLSCNDLKKQIIKCVENGLNNASSLSYEELPKLLGSHLMHNVFHCGLWCSDILWILIESAIFHVDNGLISKKRSSELNMSDKNSCENSDEILLQPNLVEGENLFSGCKDTENKDDRDSETNVTNISHTSSIILQETFVLAKENAENCDSRELLKNEFSCQEVAPSADDRKNHPSKCEYSDDEEENRFFSADYEIEDGSGYLILNDLLHNDEKSNSNDSININSHHSSSHYVNDDGNEKDSESVTLHQSNLDLEIEEACENFKDPSSDNEDSLSKKLISRNILGSNENIVQENNSFDFYDKDKTTTNMNIFHDQKRNVNEKETVLRDMIENIHESTNVNLSNGLKMESCQKDFQIAKNESSLHSENPWNCLRNDTEEDTSTEKEKLLSKSKFQESNQAREPLNLGSFESNASLDSGVSLSQIGDPDISVETSEAAEFSSTTPCCSEILALEKLIEETSNASVVAQKIPNTSKAACSKISDSSVYKNFVAKASRKISRCKNKFGSNFKRNSFSDNEIYELDAFFNIFNTLDMDIAESENVSEESAGKIDYLEKPNTEPKYETSKSYSFNSSSENVFDEDYIYKYALSIENGTVSDVSNSVYNYGVEDNSKSFKEVKCEILKSTERENYCLEETRDLDAPVKDIQKEDSSINQTHLKDDLMFFQPLSAKVVLISPDSCVAESLVDCKKKLILCCKSFFHCDEHDNSDLCFDSLTVGDYVSCYVRAVNLEFIPDSVLLSSMFCIENKTCVCSDYSEKPMNECDQFVIISQKKCSDSTNCGGHSSNNSYHSAQDNKSELPLSGPTELKIPMTANCACDSTREVTQAESSQQRSLFSLNDEVNLEKHVDIQPCTVSGQLEKASYAKERQILSKPSLSSVTTQTHLELSACESQTVISYACRSDKECQADVVSEQQGTQTMVYFSDSGTQTVIAGSIKACKESSTVSTQTTLTGDVKDCPPQLSTFCQTATLPVISQISQTENPALSVCMPYSVNFKGSEVISQSVQCGSLAAEESTHSADAVPEVLCHSGTQTISTGAILMIDYCP